MALVLPISGEKLREIERSFPEGTIYTIYSLNLRFLFELDREKELQNQIESIRLKSKIITWIKARYLQKQFEKNKEERKAMILSNDKKFGENERKEKIEELIVEFKEKYANSKKQIKDPVKLATNFLKDLINLKGEVFYFGRQKPEKSIVILGDEVANLLSILELYENWLSKLAEDRKKNENQIQKSKKELYECEIRVIEKLYYESLIKFEKHLPNQNDDFSENEIEELLRNLDKRHKEINKTKRAKKRELYTEIRKAEKFLASDEFGKFSEDPFFKIPKYEKRIIKIDDEECRLINVSNDENKLLEDGHEFSIFRGHLKDKWLNALTYRITSINQKASYFIRLSRLGLLQIRKEEHLGPNYKGDISGTLNEDFRKRLKSYQSNNYLAANGELDKSTFNNMFPDSHSENSKNLNEQVKESEKIKKAQKFLQNQNRDKKLISVLQGLLNSQQRYSNRNEHPGTTDDILQVATGFAQLLEFKTNSNYRSLFPNQHICPLSLEKVRNQRNKLERQRYTLLVFTDLKKSKKKFTSISF